MTDGVLLLLVLVPAAAAGLACLRVLGAQPARDAEALVPGLAVGLGLAGMVGLGLAAAGRLRPLPLALAGALALVAGGGDLRRTVRAAARGGGERPRFGWLLLAPCALVLAAEVVVMLAPPVGGDQTKYHLVYPSLYAAWGGLVPTPWSFWGHVQFLPNFLFAIAFTLRGDVLARLLNGTLGVLAALALAGVARRHFGRGAGLTTGVLFFTLPITWSLMTRAGADLGVVLYTAVGTGALLDWLAGGRGADLRRAGLAAGLAGGTKAMGLLVPVLLGLVVLAVALWRVRPAARAAGALVAFGGLALVAASPCYVRNAVETGNPLYPFGYGVFGGQHWSADAGEYLQDYYRQYRATHATRRDGEPYLGAAVTRFPWDLTMHPNSFENAARQSLDVGPFVLAFAPALLLVRGAAPAVWLTAGLGLGYAGIIAGAAWAHPRYVIPGFALLLVAVVPAARALLGRRAFAVLVAATVAGNLALTSRLLHPHWPDQLRVVAGRLAPEEFLRAHSARYAFWERANAEVPQDGRVLVLEKIPHPYYIQRSFVLGSYLEQGWIDYRAVDSPAALAAVARGLGVTHVALDVLGTDRAGDPFEATVTRLWRAFVADAGELRVRQGGYALYALSGPATVVAGDGGHG
jgi:4-amino-4-deoxy-L-arabinose transferase-like glycosyltransferase